MLRVSDLDDEQREELGAQVGALIGLGANGIDGFIAGAELGAEIADSGGLGVIEALGEELIEGLPDDSAAVILILEHRWAVPLRDAVMDAGGELIANRWVGVQELVRLGAALRAEAEDGGLIGPRPSRTVRRRAQPGVGPTSLRPRRDRPTS